MKRRERQAMIRLTPENYEHSRTLGLINGRGERRTSGGLSFNKFANDAIQFYLENLANAPNPAITKADLEKARIKVEWIRLDEEQRTLDSRRDELTRITEEFKDRYKAEEKARKINEAGL